MITGKLPEGWKRARFGGIAASITERVDDPSAAGVDRYVGLEHLDPESTTIRRWGSPGDVESTKLRFYPGDVIYGRRRAYQRKLGVADFDGICSAHALVLRAKPEVCLPEFLPYFLQSDAFHQRALDISVGSLSPTINWKTLAVQEFALPPVDEQRRIVDLLVRIDSVLAHHVEARARALVLADSLMRHLEDEDHPRSTLAKVCAASITRGIDQPGPHVEDGIPYVRVSDMTGGPIRLEGLARASRTIARPFERSACRAGDVVYSIRASIGLTFVVPQELEGVYLSRGTARLSPDTALVAPGYLEACLRSPSLMRQAAKATRGSTFQQVSLEALRLFEIPVPPRAVQECFVDRYKAVRTVARELEAAAVHLASLRRQALERLTNGGVSDVQ